MGSGRFDFTSYSDYSRGVSSKSVADIFTSRSAKTEMVAKEIKIRESVDSVANPNSTPVIIGVDVTGSMGRLAGTIVKHGLGTIIKGIYDDKPVSDPHIMLAAIGDLYMDQSPLQATQFEAETDKLIPQIESLFLEGGGGGNMGESYSSLWWLALNKTKCDCIDKRGQKGYIFTIGDECVLPIMPKDKINLHLDGNVEADIATADLLKEVQEDWNVFHIIVPTAATKNQKAIEVWKALLGERVVVLEDHEKLGQMIVDLMKANEGHDVHDKNWDGNTALAIKEVKSKSISNTKMLVEQV